MTAALTTSETTATHVFRDDQAAPSAVVVVVAPVGRLHECDAAIQRTVLAGAVTIACEIDADDARFADAVTTVLDTVEDALSRYPELPVVLVGHSAGAAATSLAAETFGDDISGLVITHPATNRGPRWRAA